MILEELKHFTPENGVLRLSDMDEPFEKIYFQMRKIENRFYSDDEVKLLPFASHLNPHKKEWDLRAKSFLRFKKYLSQKRSGLNILDIGCGSGWLDAQILREQNHNFYCVDKNLDELKQGAKIFSSEYLRFIYADLFIVKFPRSSFDMIIMNSSIHFFPDLQILMRELFYLLNPYGEIHIIDSPFYDENELEQARKKTFRYYDLIGLSKMKEKHFHHIFKGLNKFNYKILYDPETIKNKLLNVAFGQDSPYPWIVIKR
ncbi:MAG: class I SAM-dependent methyltransferase [Ignavibacteriaceae bacterium]